MKSVRMVAFDLVGTLIKGEIFQDSRANLSLPWNEIWEASEHDASFATSYDYVAVFEEALHKISATNLNHQFTEFLVNNVIDYAYPETIGIICALINRGMGLGFVTDGSDDVEGLMIRRIVDSCPNADSSSFIIVTGTKAEKPKSTGYPFKILLKEAVNASIVNSPNEILYVGDKLESDFNPASSEGMLAYQIKRQTNKVGIDEKTITNLATILDLI